MYYGYMPQYPYQPQPQQPTLNGQMVDGLDMVRVKDIDLSGNPTYSPIDEISGWNLQELGQWIDIVKDIAEMQYYDEKAKHTDMDVSKM